MAWRPTPLVQGGHLDNTTPGWTTGTLNLDGRPDPVRLKLVGDCHPDLAGWRFDLIRIEPEPPEPDDPDPRATYADLHADQSGHVGDVTADMMIKHFDIPSSEVVRRLLDGDRPPFTMRKCVYLEWYSNRNGRVVIQSTRLEVRRRGDRAFELTEDQWRDQVRRNNDELQYFLAQAADRLNPGQSDPDTDAT